MPRPRGADAEALDRFIEEARALILYYERQGEDRPAAALRGLLAAMEA